MFAIESSFCLGSSEVQTPSLQWQRRRNNWSSDRPGDLLQDIPQPSLRMRFFFSGGPWNCRVTSSAASRKRTACCWPTGHQDTPRYSKYLMTAPWVEIVPASAVSEYLALRLTLTKSGGKSWQFGGELASTGKGGRERERYRMIQLPFVVHAVYSPFPLGNVRD